jgi:hypothetical protein
LLVERLGDLLAVLVLAAGGLTLLADVRVYFLVCLLLVTGLTVFVTGDWLHRPLLTRLAGLPGLPNKFRAETAQPAAARVVGVGSPCGVVVRGARLP